ncbi:MAG TPA: hypothetical protein VGM30_04325 [Puia sp.]|jgi:hypothetical protein
MSFTKRKTVFISGSAYEYGKFESTGRAFVRDLTQALIKNDFKVVSGFGSGVGNYIVEGALSELYLEKKGALKDHLGIFPFPTRADATVAGQDPADGLTDQLTTIWERYRTDIISQAGIAIFIFGNKLEDIAVREADGMLKEFEIARSHQALLIPVGASGYTSEKLWKHIIEKYDDYFGTREKFGLYEQLGNPCAGPEHLIDVILQIVL